MFRKVLLFGFGVLTALGVAEIGIRIAIPEKALPPSRQPYDFKCFEKGTYNWIRFKPNCQYELKAEANHFPRTNFKINSLGLRNREVIMPKPKGEERVLFIGDSFTAGWGVEANEAFPSVVEELQLAKGRNFEAINAGLTAAGPGYYYDYLMYDGLKLDPDIVVVGMYYFSDIPYDANRTWIDQNGDDLPEKIYAHYYSVANDGSLRFNPDGTRPSQRYLPGLAEKSRLVTWAYDNLWWQGRGVSVSDYSVELGMCLFKDYCTQIDDQKQRVNLVLTGLKRLTDAAGKKLLVVLVPVEFQVNPDMAVKKYEVAVLPWEMDYPNKQLGKFLAARGIEYLDLLQVFRARGGGPYYFAEDDHWNSLGHKVAGEAVSQKLDQL